MNKRLIKYTSQNYVHNIEGNNRTCINLHLDRNCLILNYKGKTYIIYNEQMQ